MSHPRCSGPDCVALSFDLDWAPDFMLDELCSLLADLGRPFTVFATHDSPGVRRLLALPGCETGLHPNLLGCSDVPARLAELQSWFPEAQGLRCHGLSYHSGLLADLHGTPIRYLSNDLCHQQVGLRPWFDFSGLLRLPIYWEDDVHCVCGDGDFGLDALGLRAPGLKVLNFHPVHVYLNTSDLVAYQRCKETLRDAQAAPAHRASGQGVRSLLESLLQQAQALPWVGLRALAESAHSPEPWRERYGRYLERMRAGARPHRSDDEQ